MNKNSLLKGGGRRPEWDVVTTPKIVSKAAMDTQLLEAQTIFFSIQRLDNLPPSPASEMPKYIYYNCSA